MPRFPRPAGNPALAARLRDNPDAVASLVAARLAEPMPDHVLDALLGDLAVLVDGLGRLTPATLEAYGMTRAEVAAELARRTT